MKDHITCLLAALILFSGCTARTPEQRAASARVLSGLGTIGYQAAMLAILALQVAAQRELRGYAK